MRVIPHSVSARRFVVFIEERGKNASTETRRDAAEGRRGVLFARARRKRFSSSLRSFFYTYERCALRLCSLYLISHYFTFVRIDSSARARARAARARFPSRGGSEKEKVSFSIHPERVISPLVKVSRGKIKISLVSIL